MIEIMSDESLTKEQLLFKSQGVKDCVKWIEEQLKEEKKQLLKDEDYERGYGIYEDCGQFYRDQVIERKGKIEGMVVTKVSLEKYMRKLKHMADEV
jgi:hypothetical protein